MRPVPVGGVPSVLQVARGQRGRSLVFPPPPATEPPAPQQLVSGNQRHTILNQVRETRLTSLMTGTGLYAGEKEDIRHLLN